MYITFIIISFLLLIPVGVYLYFYFLRIADFWRIGCKIKKVKMLAAFLALLAIIWSVNLFGFGALIVLHLAAAALCMEALNLIYAALRKHRDIKIGLWNKIYCCGIVPVIITVLILGYGYFNMENVVETDYTIHTEKAIPQQGYRIAMIADLHFGTTMNEEKLKKYCNEIESKKPDLVVLCGDIVDEKTTKLQMENAAKILGNIKSTYGTFYVYGNHDKSTYASKPNFSEDQLKKQLVSNEIHVLEDEIYNINDEFTIIGRKDKGFSSGIKRKTSDELLKNVHTNNFLLLLDHQPSELQENSAAGMDLQLSGHTHGGQIWPVD
ncbi:MAG: Phosphoesterase [Clostridiaceae bacterium]|jgi:predicted MPP superfamily phosphohydrolase|nr:Phosphoesterase [Clostridiaceae bacterium]